MRNKRSIACLGSFSKAQDRFETVPCGSRRTSNLENEIASNRLLNSKYYLVDCDTYYNFLSASSFIICSWVLFNFNEIPDEALTHANLLGDLKIFRKKSDANRKIVFFELTQCWYSYGQHWEFMLSGQSAAFWGGCSWSIWVHWLFAIFKISTIHFVVCYLNDKSDFPPF